MNEWDKHISETYGPEALQALELLRSKGALGEIVDRYNTDKWNYERTRWVRDQDKSPADQEANRLQRALGMQNAWPFRHG